MDTIYRVVRKEKDGTIRASSVMGHRAQARGILNRVLGYSSTAEAWLEASEVTVEWEKVEA
jgi:hypothetical protein